MRVQLILQTILDQKPLDLRFCSPNLRSGYATVASVYQKLIRSTFSPLREEDLDHLCRFENMDVTACREAPIFDTYPDSDDKEEPHLDDCLDLIVIVTPQGRSVF